MNALTFQLRLLEPVLATRPESGEENSSSAYGYIPGAMLRGALIAKYRQANPRIHLASDPTARRLFLDGAVRYLNAYPSAAPSARMLPAPCAWQVAKEQADDERAVIYDFSIEPNDKLDNTKNPDGEFCPRDAQSAQLYTVHRQMNVHNVSENRVEKRAGSSNVFRYDAIAAGENLGAVILADDPNDLGIVQKLLPDNLLLGGANTAGYGRVEISDAQIEANWSEYDPSGYDSEEISKSKIDLTGWVIVTLLSDTIVRDRNGQVAMNLNMALANVLGLAQLKHECAFQQLSLVGGFNRKAGLPLAQDWAIAAGSVIVCRADEVPLIKLHELQAKGIGERRAEGFGRFAINWHNQKNFSRQPFTPPSTLGRPITLSDTSQKIALRMARRRLKRLLDEKLIYAVNQTKIDHHPENAQLSRVRVAAQQALSKHTLGDVIELMNNLHGARSQFENARVRGVALKDWILQRAQQQDIEIQFSLNPSEFPRVAGFAADLTGLRVEYTAQLINGVMNKAIREKPEGTT